MEEGEETDETVRRPPPVVFRVEAPRDMPSYFAALGTKIMAMHPRGSEENLHPLVPKRSVSVFDVESRTISRGPRPKKDPENFLPMYIGIDDRRLFALGDYTWDVLEESSAGEWAWKSLGEAPFIAGAVYAYAVHPVGPTVMVCYGFPLTPNTVIFNVNGSSLRWERYGGEDDLLYLPFSGRAHYVPELDGWVGITQLPHPAGHLCLCSLPSLDSSSVTRSDQLTVKVSKEALLSIGCSIGVILLYMGSADGGSSSQFCLFEPLTREEFFRVTTFSLKLDADGELTAGNTSRIRDYSLPVGAAIPNFYDLTAAAFWM